MSDPSSTLPRDRLLPASDISAPPCTGGARADGSATQTATERRNLAAVSAVLHGWNVGDVDEVLRWYDPDIHWHDVAMEEVHRGTGEVGRQLATLFSAFPDLSFTVGRRIAKGDLVAEEWTLRGTHRGEFLGIPATGRSVNIQGMSMVEMRDGRFLTDCFYFDGAGAMRQLGLLPSMSATRSGVGRALVGFAARSSRAASSIAGKRTRAMTRIRHALGRTQP